MAVSTLKTCFFKSKDGTLIYAQAAGDPSKPHVVLIHGLALSAMAFSKQFHDQKLLDSLYLVAYDMRGHGRSGMPDNTEAYSSALIAADFYAVVEGFRLNKPFLAGWSLGGTIAADVCAVYGPSMLSGVIYLAGLPYIGDIQPKIGTPLVGQLVQGLLNSDAAIVSSSVVAFVDSTVLEPAKLAFETKVAWVGCVALQPPSVRRCLLTRTQDPRKLLDEGAKRWPLLVLHGSDDAQIQGEQLIKEMKAVFVDCEAHLIPDAGHAMFWDKPEIVREKILSFVTRVSNSG